MGKRGRPCTICQHPQLEKINKLLAPSDPNFAAWLALQIDGRLAEVRV